MENENKVLEILLARYFLKLDKIIAGISKEVKTLPIESGASERLCDELFIYISVKSELELILEIHNQPEGEK